MNGNICRHKNSEYLFGHFSSVDKFDLTLFPNLKFTNPIHFKLNKGESIYIPKGWWHWIKSTTKSFAINYWFSNDNKLDPFIFNNDTEFDINSLNEQEVYVWDSSNDDLSHNYTTSFDQFYQSELDDRFVVTLDTDYPNDATNAHIKNMIKPHINFPTHQKLSYCDNFDYNLWISSGKHDTGLHYDDEDGVLTLIEGSKNITLFPPSDSDNLYPILVEYFWRNHKATNFWYNSFYNHGNVKGVSSSELLYITCDNNKRVLSNISKLYRNNQNNLVWGFKKSNEGYRWEIYKYHPENDGVSNPVIVSWDIFNNSYKISDTQHHYYRDTNYEATLLPFWGYCKFKKNNVYYEESRIFVIDNYPSFRDDYNLYMNELGYNNIKDKFKNIILEKYKCYQICIHNKTENQIFVQYLGISNKDFISFLNLYDYPSHIINFVQEQVGLDNYKINNEITIVYEIDTQKVIRTGFYGNI